MVYNLRMFYDTLIYCTFVLIDNFMIMTESMLSSLYITNLMSVGKFLLVIFTFPPLRKTVFD